MSFINISKLTEMSLKNQIIYRIQSYAIIFGNHYLCNFAHYLNLSECPPLKDQCMVFSLSYCSVYNTIYRMDKKTLDALKLKAKRISFEVFRMSMICCNLLNLCYLKENYFQTIEDLLF